MDQQFQHTKLMNEFKQAHQKMFKSLSNEGEGSLSPLQNNVIGQETMVNQCLYLFKLNIELQLLEKYF